MQTIKIFIASSFELRRWREAIGNSIRLLSDEFEPKGFRIKLNCWEDYHPEFSGTRKQDEYNEDLIKPCNLFFGLFWEVCGAYTCEEIRVANGFMPDNVHVIRKISCRPTDDVDKYLVNLNHSNDIYECDHIKEALTFIKNVIINFIRRCPKFIIEPENRRTYNVYATIPDDRRAYRIKIGNLIRSMDNLVEETLMLRCKLRSNCLQELSKSNYFLGLLKDDLSKDDKQEITYAIEHARPESNPEVALVYYKNNDKVGVNNPDIHNLFDKYGTFNEEFDNLHRVRYNLLVWFLSKKLLTVDDDSRLSVCNGWASFMDQRIAPCSTIGIKGESDIELYSNLLEDIQSRMSNWTQKSSNYNPAQPIDIASLEREIDCATKIGILAHKIEHDSLRMLTQLLGEINARLDNIESSNRIRENLKEAILLSVKKEELVSKLYYANLETIDNWLRCLIQLANFCESDRKLALRVEVDTDNIYKRITSIADMNHFYSVHVEIMRMNYANYLSRQNRNKEAVKCYDTTLQNIYRFDDGSPIMVSYITAIFLNFSHALVELGEITMMEKVTVDFEKRVKCWQDRNILLLPEIAYRIFILAVKLSDRNTDNYIKYIGESLTIWNRIDELKPMVKNSDNCWDDIFCNFPMTIMAAIIDSGTFFDGMKIIESIAAKTKDLIECNVYFDESIKLFYFSEIYHNLAFANSNIGNNEEARKNGCKALELRKKLFKFKKDPYIRREIASNLLMIGATYINSRNTHLSPQESQEALSYAQKSLDIAQSLNNGDFVEEVVDVYKAKLLIGTILFFTRNRRQEGLDIVNECLIWSRNNPTNSYRDTFEYEALRLNNLKSC